MAELLAGGSEQAKGLMTTANVDQCEPDVDRLANIIWSYLGRPMDGWREEDEEQWDEAIVAVRANMDTMEGFTKMQSGKTRIRLIANIVIATK